MLKSLQVGLGFVSQGILKGKYHCTVDLFDWFGISCMQGILKGEVSLYH